MANQSHLDLLKLGVPLWNSWRERNPYLLPDLEGADLRGTDLRRADLSNVNLKWADLREADLREAHLYRADLDEARLSNVNLSCTNLNRANLHKTDLRQANLKGANLRETDLTNTDLEGANLEGTNLIGAVLCRTNLKRANLTGCMVYATSAWEIQLENTVQSNLIITTFEEPTITVDNIEVAQFIYLLLNNPKIRDVIDTIARKAVLILGRFPNERKKILEALRNELRTQDYSPVVYNFEGTENKDFTATVKTLAHMARFVLVDLTDLDETIREIADEIVPRCIIPIRPLLLQGSHRQEDELFRELQRKYHWVVAPYRYKDVLGLQTSFQEKFLQPIYEKMIELKQKKPLKVFLAYASEDKKLLTTLKTHLRPLARAGVIELWDEQEIAPGEERGKEIERRLCAARLILLLISPAYLSAHDCYDIHMSMALERYSRGEARVIPILLRPCAWQSTPLKDLQPLPKDGRPISKHNKDDVFFEVSEDIGEVIRSLE